MNNLKTRILQSRNKGSFTNRFLYQLRRLGLWSKARWEMFRAWLYFTKKKPDTKKLFPDFLVAGMQKSATSWLDKMFRIHDDIFLPPNRKEVHFFDAFRWKGLKWYLYHFIHAGNKLKGEVTPAYSIISTESIKEIRNYNPNCKILFLLRNPVDRAWSQMYMDLIRHQGRREEDVDLNEFIEMIDSESVVQRGNYLLNLKRWYSVFPEDQVHIEFYESISQEPEAMLNRVFAFLDVDESSSFEKYPIHKRVNQNKSTKMPHIIEAKLKSKYRLPTEELYEFMPHPIIKEWMKNTM